MEDPENPSQALKELRDTLRALSSDTDIEDFNFTLSTTLTALHLHPTSVTSSGNISSSVRAIERYLPAVQESLLVHAIPTYLPALDNRGLDLLQRFFVPPRSADLDALAISREVATSSYGTLTRLLSTKRSQDLSEGSLPPQGREYVLKTTADLVRTYGIDELYWGVWGQEKQSAHAESSKSGNVRMLKWEEVVRAAVSLPAKVANAVGMWKSEGGTLEVPDVLVPRVYFDRLVLRLETLMYEESQRGNHSDSAPLRMVIERLASIGLLSLRPTTTTMISSPNPNLITAMLPPLLQHLHPPPDSPLPPYPTGYLPKLFLPLPTTTLTTFARSLIDHLSLHLGVDALEPSRPSEQVYRAATVLKEVLGPAVPGEEAWGAILQSVTDSTGGTNRANVDQGKVKARVVVAWIASGGLDAAIAFLGHIIPLWIDSKYIKYALYGPQLHLTYTLLLTLSLIPPFHSSLIRHSHQARFLSAMQTYLAHPDPSIRRLGMLVAEIISHLTIADDGMDVDRENDDNNEIEELKAGLDGEVPKKSKPKGGKRLKFSEKMWEGDGEGKEEARCLRSCVGVKDSNAEPLLDPSNKPWLLGWDSPKASEAEETTTQPLPPTTTGGRGRPVKKETKPQKPPNRPKIVMLDEEQTADPLQGYASSPSSSRSPSPTPSYLEEVTADPSLAIDAASRKKIKRPVYISQLITLLKAREEPDQLEVALKWGESLIRSKRSFGAELDENAAQVATLAIALNDPFNLEGFDENRQGILNALVACAPKAVAPCLCELYFIGSYSLHQRSIMLTALAMGARELAGMTVPDPPKTKRVDFPSKTLPPALHRKYVSAADQPRGQIEEAIDGVRGLLISKGVKKGEETVPELAREKRLRVGSTTRNRVAEVDTPKARQMAAAANGQAVPPSPIIPFKDVAAEYFIMPLINRFWQHFQDASVRQDRAMTSGTRYRGAGAGLLLSPMALEKFLMTLALLLHAARHSSFFLAVLTPEALDLAATIGVRHPSEPSVLTTEVEADGSSGANGQEASVVGAALEVALVVLDASVDLDSGRSLAMDKHALLMGIGEWASGVFAAEERGGEVSAGQGGLREGRVRAAAAGVMLKVSEVAEKWGRLSVM